MTEICSRCMCSCRAWAGSRAVGCVVWARSSDSVMDTWKYSVPFSNHCCFQWTWEISSPVPDISAERTGREGKKGHLIHEKFTFEPSLFTHLVRKLKRKNKLNSLWGINQSSNVTVWLCISILVQRSVSAATRNLELANSWTDFLGCHNFVHLCSWLGKNYCQAIALLSCFDEIFMMTISSPVVLVRKIPPNSKCISVKHHNQHSTSIIDKMSHRRLILVNIQLFTLSFFLSGKKHRRKTIHLSSSIKFTCPEQL